MGVKSIIGTVVHIFHILVDGCRQRRRCSEATFKAARKSAWRSSSGGRATAAGPAPLSSAGSFISSSVPDITDLLVRLFSRQDQATCASASPPSCAATAKSLLGTPPHMLNQRIPKAAWVRELGTTPLMAQHKQESLLQHQLWLNTQPAHHRRNPVSHWRKQTSSHHPPWWCQPCDTPVHLFYFIFSIIRSLFEWQSLWQTEKKVHLGECWPLLPFPWIALIRRWDMCKCSTK